jgi:hypothetical protein
MLLRRSVAVQFASQLPNLQSGDSGLTFNIWQRVVTERYKKYFIHANSSDISMQRAECVGAMLSIMWLDFNKGVCFL